MVRAPFLFALLAAAPASFAQQATLSNGTMHVQEGTTLRFTGPLQFTIGPAGALINDGLIDLGTQAVVVEPVGSPISGSGVEMAVTATDGPFNATAPGGLGLSLTTNTATGPITVTRGHLARVFPEGDPSIARWFRLEAPGGGSAPVDVVLSYDATELNGLSGSAIGLYQSTQEDGPWSSLASTNDAAQYTVSATLPAPWDFITAFDQDAPTASASLVARNGVEVWPTLTHGPLFIQVKDGAALEELDLFDGLGRLVTPAMHQRSSTFASMDLSGLANGPYFLRIGQRTTIKLRKE
ncbi:MAG: hypothetical protein E6Q44_06950 [Flavobacteriales bacterium]|nr:MAG: hypothetical protein E6Q44_06950 [Flavobacteriales bacterium]